jgi:hypothetical protein
VYPELASGGLHQEIHPSRRCLMQFLRRTAY